MTPDVDDRDRGRPRRGWGSPTLDLDGYLRRISYGGPTSATSAVLRELHRAHVLTIPFENLDILLGRGIRLDVGSLQDKLVRRDRGGYCYEHNLLFAAALESLGFETVGLAARVVLPEGRTTPPTHMALRVLADGCAWLADVGFGGSGPIEPIELTDGATSTQGSWSYRLEMRSPETWVLRSLYHARWRDLYQFSLQPHRADDYTVYNHYTATHPDSPFVTGLSVQLSGPHVAHRLTDRVLTALHPNRAEQHQDIPPSQLGHVLRETFGVRLTAGEMRLVRQTLHR